MDSEEKSQLKNFAPRHGRPGNSVTACRFGIVGHEHEFFGYGQNFREPAAVGTFFPQPDLAFAGIESRSARGANDGNQPLLGVERQIGRDRFGRILVFNRGKSQFFVTHFSSTAFFSHPHPCEKPLRAYPMFAVWHRVVFGRVLWHFAQAVAPHPGFQGTV